MTIIDNEGKTRRVALELDTGNTSMAIALDMRIYKYLVKTGFITCRETRTINTVSTDSVSSKQTCPTGELRYRHPYDESKILTAKVFGCSVPVSSKKYDDLLPRTMMNTFGLLI